VLYDSAVTIILLIRQLLLRVALITMFLLQEVKILTDLMRNGMAMVGVVSLLPSLNIQAIPRLTVQVSRQW
jgi:hypothetical protein